MAVTRPGESARNCHGCANDREDGDGFHRCAAFTRDVSRWFDTVTFGRDGLPPRETPPCPNFVDRNQDTPCPGFAERDEAQPAPIPNDRPAVWDLVIADMRSRDAKGLRAYGTRLQPGNGRDALRDAYEEALDLAVYLRQAIEERSPTSPPGAGAWRSLNDRP